jgi:hypothetical protein
MSRSSPSAATEALHIHRGDQTVLLMHEIGADQNARANSAQRASQTLGAWTYTQRGHTPGNWVGGGYYPLSVFCADLALVLAGIGEPTLVISLGLSSTIVAGLLAASLPELVSGLQALPGNGGPWDDPGLIVADSVRVNPAWWRTVTSVAASSDTEIDPTLSAGPPHAIPEMGLRHTLGELDRAWHAPTGHPAREWFPTARLAPGPLVRSIWP